MTDVRMDPVYGMMAVFVFPFVFLTATQRAYSAGYRKMDAYSPYPIEELADALGFHKTRVPLIVLVGSILGGLSGYLLQYWISAVSYPINIGGRPFHSWPAFIVVTFEMTILFGGISAVGGRRAVGGRPGPGRPGGGGPRGAGAGRGRGGRC